jgi:hypothetical protein
MLLFFLRVLRGKLLLSIIPFTAKDAEENLENSQAKEPSKKTRRDSS